MIRRRESVGGEDLDVRETEMRLALPRRVVDIPVASSNPTHGPSSSAVSRVAVGGDLAPTAFSHDPHTDSASEARQLLIGRGIRVEGAVEGCEHLIVEGELKATLETTGRVVVRDQARFEGEGEVETAEIAGLFEGSLTVRGRLLVRSTGRVCGDIHFGELEVERGGQIAGKVDAHGRGPQLASVAAAFGGGD